MTPDKPFSPPDADEWLPAGNLRWIVALAIVGLVIVTAAYAMGAVASH